MTDTTTARDTTTDTACLRRLLADLHAAGWRHAVEYHRGDRDWETGAFENSGYKVHRWTRRLDAIEVVWAIDAKAFIGSVVLGPRYPEDEMFTADTRVQVAVGWIVRHGAVRLHRLAQAAGVLNNNVGPATTRPDPVGA